MRSTAISISVALTLLTATPVPAQMTVVNQAAADKLGGMPQFQVDAFWPKPLPNNWLLGQVAGIRADRNNHIWVLHRPNSLTARERIAEQVPPPARCCVAAPPVLVFDTSGNLIKYWGGPCLLYTSPSPRDRQKSRMPSSA